MNTSLHIGFLSTRFAGTDGVSLETEKWAAVLERLDHSCFYFAGSSDRDSARSRIVPEALFKHPDVDAIYQAAFSLRARPPEVTRRIHELRAHLKEQVYAFVRDFDLDLLIVENALAIP